MMDDMLDDLTMPAGLGDHLTRYAGALSVYDNDALFDDLVAETTARVERLARGR